MDDNSNIREPEIETRCGLGKWRPSCLQRFNNPKVVCVLLSLFAFVHGFHLNGINNVNAVAYERRFQLSSATVGWISSSADISASVFGIFISFYASNRNKARFIAAAILTAGLGSTVMFLPHFITGLYQWSSLRPSTCLAEDSRPEECDSSDVNVSKYVYMLAFGQALHGIGSTTLTAVGMAYMDDSVDTDWSPIYLCIILMCYVLGPVIGFVAGGNFLSIYVDFDKVPKSEQVLTLTHAAWVGAWWLPYTMTAALLYCISVPFWFLGEELPTAKEVREKRRKLDAEQNVKSEKIHIRQMPVAIISLLKNTMYVFITFADTSFSIILSGSMTFINKFMQNQFGLTAQKASNLLGLISIPFVILGMMSGAIIMRCLKTRVRGILRILLVMTFISTLSKMSLFLNCGQPGLIGFNRPYDDNSPISMSNQCNRDCHCDPTRYQPVCDDQGNRFFNPCLAGCNNSTTNRVYAECSCVKDTNSTDVAFSKCPNEECSNIWLFLVGTAVISGFANSGTIVPSISVVLRAVDESKRAFALGVYGLSTRLLGTLPGPVIYGSLIDNTCEIWGEKCGQRTNCLIYDTKKFGYSYGFLTAGLSFLAFVFYGAALKFFKGDKSGEDSELKTAEVANEPSFDTRL